MAFDAKSGRLFIGSRDPGKLFVINASDGSIIQSLQHARSGHLETVATASSRWHKESCLCDRTSRCG
jgi:hypothetical protein